MSNKTLKKMGTLYCNMPEVIQYYLASMLSLSEQRKPTITLAYTGSDPKWPEKILNLRWSLEGDWKIMNFKEHFDKKTEQEIFNDFLELMKKGKESKNSGYTDYNNYAAWLFQSARKLEVSGKNFETGVTNLFNLASERTELRISDQTICVPSVLIQRTVHNGHYSSYEMFIYVESEKTFMNILYGNKTPNYVKDFLELESKMVAG